MENSNRNVLIVVLVLAIVICCCAALVLGGLLVGGLGLYRAGTVGDIGNVEASQTYSESINVDTPAVLDVDVNVGSVDVVAGLGDTMEIQAEIKAYGATSETAERALAAVRFDVIQSGSTIRIAGDWPGGRNWQGRSPRVDLRVVVPRQTQVDVEMNVGEINLAGTEGDVDIQCDVGQVRVRDVVVSDELQIKTDVAEIDFNSALTVGADYSFESDVAAIRLLLPADSSFAIDASSDVGAVDVQFDVVGERSRDFVGQSVKGVVNGGLETTLTARSDVGSISVRPQ